MKIAQMIPTRMIRLNLNITDTLEETVRGNGGFGSTGV
jgi:dUTPase